MVSLAEILMFRFDFLGFWFFTLSWRGDANAAPLHRPGSSPAKIFFLDFFFFSEGRLGRRLVNPCNVSSVEIPVFSIIFSFCAFFLG